MVESADDRRVVPGDSCPDRFEGFREPPDGAEVRDSRRDCESPRCTSQSQCSKPGEWQAVARDQRCGHDSSVSGSLLFGMSFLLRGGSFHDQGEQQAASKDASENSQCGELHSVSKINQTEALKYCGSARVDSNADAAIR